MRLTFSRYHLDNRGHAFRGPGSDGDGPPDCCDPVGSIPEIIDGNGYLVSLLQPEDPANAMIALMEHPELATRLGKRSRKLALRYDLDLMIRRYQEVLVEAVGSTT